MDRPTGDGPFAVLVGFHGYAENAEHMLDVLMRIHGARPWLLVSVQALNRFYNRSDDVVIANWMTRQDREQAIVDNIAYVTSVVSAVRRDYSTNDTLVYAGFSQGVAMAYRAAVFIGTPRIVGSSGFAEASADRRSLGRSSLNPPSPSGLILLAGDVPPDVAPHASRLPPLLLGRGRTDHWYTDAKAAADLDLLRAAGARVATHVFEGGHAWDKTFVARAGEFLDSLDVQATEHRVTEKKGQSPGSATRRKSRRHKETKKKITRPTAPR